jgi:hypothetical protein
VEVHERLGQVRSHKQGKPVKPQQEDREMVAVVPFSDHVGKATGFGCPAFTRGQRVVSLTGVARPESAKGVLFLETDIATPFADSGRATPAPKDARAVIACYRA